MYAQGVGGLGAPIHLWLRSRWTGRIEYIPQRRNLARSVSSCHYYMFQEYSACVTRGLFFQHIRCFLNFTLKPPNLDFGSWRCFRSSGSLPLLDLSSSSAGHAVAFAIWQTVLTMATLLVLISYFLSPPQEHMRNSGPPPCHPAKAVFKRWEQPPALSLPQHAQSFSSVVASPCWPADSLWSSLLPENLTGNEGSGSLCYHIHPPSILDFSYSPMVTCRVSCLNSFSVV